VETDRQAASSAAAAQTRNFPVVLTILGNALEVTTEWRHLQDEV
jgi:hypothetical protein